MKIPASCSVQLLGCEKLTLLGLQDFKVKKNDEEKAKKSVFPAAQWTDDVRGLL
jgi:lipid-A-disaccharide synthase-like uncharacterized protein